MDTVESMVVERRRQLGDPGLPTDASDIWGVALSGGGIRSATFCLGLLRSLAASGMLRRFDVMSTVSGGGYVGSMLGKMLHHAPDSQGVEKVYEALGRAEERWFTWWLRANGRYLIPRGVRDRFFAGALFVRNLIGIHAEVGVAALLLAAASAMFNLLMWVTLSGESTSVVRWFSADVLAWMPTLWLLAVVPLFCAVVQCCLYWALPTVLDPRRGWYAGMVVFWGLVVGLLVVLRPSVAGQESTIWPSGSWLLWLVLLTLALGWLAALLIAPGRVSATRKHLATAAPAAAAAQAAPAAAAAQAAADEDHLRGVLRNRITESLVTSVAWLFGILLAGLVERLGWFLAFEVQGLQGWYGSALLLLSGVLRVVVPKLAPASGTARPLIGLPLTLLGQAIGWLLVLALLVWWVSVGHGLVFEGWAPGQAPAVPYWRAGLMALLCGLYIAFTGRNIGFLNASSLHGFYRSRLSRSFLGAANARRVGTTAATSDAVLAEPPEATSSGHRGPQVRHVEREDDVPMSAYAPHANGGLVHLMGVCLNETQDHRGGLFNQDRRGRPLTLGPRGSARIGLGPWSSLDPAGASSLSTWMAVSGAALAPGLGSMTRPGLSALIALAGMRLGFWWDSHDHTDASVRGGKRRFPAKTWLLMREILGRFDIGHRDWYLSDGGHFENTGAYALLASHARLIVVADCGADPAYRFSDLENLVRKARVDLGADITFLRPRGPGTDPRLKAFGSLNDLKLETSSACLALARVRYRREAGQPAQDAVMVIVKPNVSLDLPVDLHNFKQEFPEFPQQSTTDQFFSEAQWESYFVLGSVIGSKLDPDVLRDLPEVADRCFEEDTSASETSARIPARFGKTTVAAASLSAGALAGLGVAGWQALATVGGAQEARPAANQLVLKDLSDLFGKLGTTPHPDAALPALASTLLRLGDSQCGPSGDPGWFHRSSAAVCMLRTALQLCETRKDRMPSCGLLVDTDTAKCLDPSPRANVNALNYWAVSLRPPITVDCPPSSVHSLDASASPPDTAPTVPALAPAPAAASPSAPAPPAPPVAPICAGYTVYTQIHGGLQREQVMGLRDPWRQLGASVPGIEDVNATAARNGTKPPRPFGSTTVLYPTDASLACARALKSAGEAYRASSPGWSMRQLPASLQPSQWVIEVWIAPGWGVDSATTSRPAS